MPIDDDDDDFDPNDFDFEDDDPEETRREHEARRKRIDDLPLMKKAWEVYRLTKTIVETMRETDSPMAQPVGEQLLADAMTLIPKIAGAEGSELYSLKMENAVVIKIHARSLLTTSNWLSMEKLTPPEHIKLLRDAIDEFRRLFIAWVDGFDKTDDIPDDWGSLFR